MRTKLRVSLCSLTLMLGMSSALVLADDRPVHHLVFFQFKSETSPAQIGEIVREFAALPSRVPGVKGFQWGTNNSPEGLNDGLTHGFLMTFENQAALDAYATHPKHLEFVDLAIPRVQAVFVNDFAVDSAPAPAEPGRCHHLVFFKYKDSATDQQIATVASAFQNLESEISGLINFQRGENRTPENFDKGYHAFWLTFKNERARNDYLPHPAHKNFGKSLGPVLEKPVVFDFTARPSSRSLFVTSGLEPYRVYQRDEQGFATIDFEGVSSADGVIEARLRKGRRTVSAFDWKKVGESKSGEFRAKLERVPTGGEYTVEVRRRDGVGNIAAHTEVADILVGDIWILAGQSNMQGVGNLEDVSAPHPLVNCFTMGHRWENAVEPLHWLIDSPDPVHNGSYFRNVKNESDRRVRRAGVRKSRSKGAGLGLPFARAMVRETGIPVGLIASAHGGTSMQQWDPAGRDKGAASLYGSMIKQVANAGGKVRGVLWYQGESDANPAAAPLFGERFRGLISAMRRDFGDEKLPFYYVQIGRFVRAGGASGDWDRIQELQRDAANSIPGVGMISVIDLPLDDLIHVGTNGLKRAGERLAKLAMGDLFGGSHSSGPRLKKVERSGNDLRLTYSGINGKLSPDENIRGFSVYGSDGVPLRLIYNAFVDPEAADTVILKLQKNAPAAAQLWYGKGLDPVCNLVDEADLAAPVFGPWVLK